MGATVADGAGKRVPLGMMVLPEIEIGTEWGWCDACRREVQLPCRACQVREVTAVFGRIRPGKPVDGNGRCGLRFDDPRHEYAYRQLRAIFRQFRENGVPEKSARLVLSGFLAARVPIGEAVRIIMRLHRSEKLTDNRSRKESLDAAKMEFVFCRDCGRDSGSRDHAD